jgi:hypothetical protein
LATENIIPIAPPYSGPRLREIIKYAPPVEKKLYINPIVLSKRNTMLYLSIDLHVFDRVLSHSNAVEVIWRLFSYPGGVRAQVRLHALFQAQDVL